MSYQDPYGARLVDRDCGSSCAIAIDRAVMPTHPPAGRQPASVLVGSAILRFKFAISACTHGLDAGALGVAGCSAAGGMTGSVAATSGGVVCLGFMERAF
jgi:hypothetical protein